MGEIVAVLGASPKRERYSNQAVRLLREKGHRAVPVHPTHAAIEGLKAWPDLPSALREHSEIHTVTVYVNPGRRADLAETILAARPRRVILNPGTENAELKRKLESRGVRVAEACTLVMLRTGQF